MFWNCIANPDDSGDMPPLDQLKGRPIGKVTREQVIEALKYQRVHGGLLGNVMVKLGFIQPDDIVAALAGQRGECPLPPAGQAR
jgi:hypothetical protein